ncbi:MAG TPA: ATP phosphoribosyltransferase [bacterium]|nr:ATP phosphoribosyltransferase [bacterium]
MTRARDPRGADLVTIAVPSGRLLDDTMQTLEAAGYVDGDAWRTSRRLIVPGTTPAIRCLIAKPVDLLTYVEHGAADLGVAGKDVLLEQGRDVYELVDLGFGACRGVLAFPEPLAGTWERLVPLRIATKYPRITERHFGSRGRPVEIIPMNGTVELAPQVGLADGIMDLVMSGRTLRENGLVEVAELFPSTARLVVNRVSLRSRAGAVASVIDGLRAAVARPASPAEGLTPPGVDGGTPWT